MSDAITAAEQLRDEVADRADGLAGLLGPDDHLAHTALWERWGRTAEAVAAQLAVDAYGDDHAQRAAAQACADVLNALWPAADPPDEWWLTPLGRLCASSLGVEGSEMVSAHVAAAMLGVHPSQIGALVATGRLDRHPDGGIVAASVHQLRQARGG